MLIQALRFHIDFTSALLMNTEFVNLYISSNLENSDMIILYILISRKNSQFKTLLLKHSGEYHFRAQIFLLSSVFAVSMILGWLTF